MSITKGLSGVLRFVFWVAVIIVAVAWFRWGTLDPCEAVRKEVLWSLIDAARTPVQRATLPQALREANSNLSVYASSQRPRRCLVMLWRANVEGRSVSEGATLKSMLQKDSEEGSRNEEGIKKLLPKVPESPKGDNK